MYFFSMSNLPTFPRKDTASKKNNSAGISGAALIRMLYHNGRILKNGVSESTVQVINQGKLQLYRDYPDGVIWAI